MTPEATINKLLRDIVNLILATPNYAIAAKQNFTRPTGSYGDVDFVTDRNIGWEHVEYEDIPADPDILQKINGQREITMSLGFYRDGAIDNSRKVRTGFIKESIQEILSAAGMGLTSRSPVREITEKLENGWEERSQFDIVLNTVGSDEDIIRSILSVDLSGLYEANGLSYNFNIEVQ